MAQPGLPSLLFLAWILIVLPVAAVRSARRVAALVDAGAEPAVRTRIWIGTILTQASLLALASAAAFTLGYQPFAAPMPSRTDIVAAVTALAACFALRQAAQLLHSEPERRSLVVYRVAPRTRTEHRLWFVAVLAASLAEEVAYRGVAVRILQLVLGTPIAAIAIAAAAFSAAHALQGWKNAGVIFGFALVMHALVAVTGSLVLAIAVHAVYDLIAGTLILRDAHRHVGG